MVAEAAPTGMDPAALRAEALDLARRILATGPADPVEAVARRVPVTVLGRALGVRDLDALVAAVPPAAAVYLSGTDRPAKADAAVAVLVQLLGPGSGGSGLVVANRIAILMQACEATAALIRNAVRQASGATGRWPAEAIVAETLRFDPPVPALRRIASVTCSLGGRTIDAGTAVTLDLRAANRDPAVFADPDRFDPGRTEPSVLTFGVGRRPCPGAGHAVHLAAGTVDAILGLTEETAR
ncbi:MAG: cytochrome P450 [Streptosporangiales bacterium]|nr:cytochrome P450 [Streptosporangiales bacterium]